jgi:hypothetical protein
MMAVEPESLKVRLSAAARAGGYAHLEGTGLGVAAKGRPSRRALALRWAIFQEAVRQETPADAS